MTIQATHNIVRSTAAAWRARPFEKSREVATLKEKTVAGQSQARTGYLRSYDVNHLQCMTQPRVRSFIV